MLEPETDCWLITAFDEINRLQRLEQSLFSPNTFDYERDFLNWPFKEHFERTFFMESHDFFRQENEYIRLIEFLKSIGSSLFYISAPAYCGLYPLAVSANCPFSTYKNAVSYVLEENMMTGGNRIIRQPVGHPMRGVGFVIMPQVFMYDTTKQWAISLEDSVTPVAVIGLKSAVREQFERKLTDIGFTTVDELVKRPNMQVYDPKFLRKITHLYQTN